MRKKFMMTAAFLASCLTTFSAGATSTAFAEGAYVAAVNSAIIGSNAIQRIKDNNKSDAINKNVKEVAVGELFNITLEENLSTGYSWSYTSDSNDIKLIGENNNQEMKPDRNLVGAPSKKTWAFKADKKGTYTLKFSYAQPWEKSVPAAKTVTYTIKVTDKASDSGGVVTLKSDGTNTVQKGQKFNITLEENLSTGYSWSYTSDSNDIKLIGENNNNREMKPDRNLVGAPSKKTWAFKVDKKGTYTLKFSYAQPWMTNTRPDKIVTYKVIVN